MALIAQSDAQAALAPYHDILEHCVTAAWTRWQELQAHLPPFTRRGRRAIMHELITHEARTRFGGLSDVKIRETRSGRFLVVIGNIVLRFKKLRSRFQTSNYPTQTAIKFDAQMDLPGIPKGARLTVGYMLNELETELQGVFLVLSKAKQLLWQYKLGKEDGELIVRDLFPVEPKGPRIKPKKPDEAKRKRRRTEE